jgi:signal transduction histidine kinase
VLGHQLPRLGAASISLLALTIGLTFLRYGYSMLAPGAFSHEILSTIREGVVLLRLDGVIHSANTGMGRLLGISAPSLEGRPIAELCDIALPNASEPVQDRECSLLPPERDPVPVSVCTSVLRDKQQNAIGIVLVARDLREIESLRSRLITSGRLASVGQLAAGIAHEINNPVAYVRANLGSLGSLIESLDAGGAMQREHRDELADGRELIAESLDGVDRVAAIVRDVKSFSHAGAAGLERVEIRPLLESVLRVAGPQLRYGATVETSFGQIPAVRGSAQQLQQVFLNLVMNASQAVDDTGTIQLSTLAEGGRVVILIEDDGYGIPADQLARVFDPFFTTKPVGEGTGLGLSISYQIVTSHHGELTVESEPGRGTCFRVELPAANDA